MVTWYMATSAGVYSNMIYSSRFDASGNVHAVVTDEMEVRIVKLKGTDGTVLQEGMINNWGPVSTYSQQVVVKSMAID